MVEFTMEDCRTSKQKAREYDWRIDYVLADKMFHSDDDTDINCAVAIITLGIEIYLRKNTVYIMSNPASNVNNFPYIDYVCETLTYNKLCK